MKDNTRWIDTQTLGSLQITRIQVCQHSVTSNEDGLCSFVWIFSLKIDLLLPSFVGDIGTRSLMVDWQWMSEYYQCAHWCVLCPCTYKYTTPGVALLLSMKKYIIFFFKISTVSSKLGRLSPVNSLTAMYIGRGKDVFLLPTKTWPACCSCCQVYQPKNLQPCVVN